MSKEKLDLANIADLFSLSTDGEISDQQFEALKTTLKNSKAARHYYYHLVNLEVSLRDSKELFEQVEELPCDAELWQSLADYEKTAPALEIKEPLPEQGPVKMLKVEKAPRVINKFSLYSAILSAAALIFLLIYIQTVPPAASVVATITDSVDAQWWPSEHPTKIGSQLWNNEGPRYLRKGAVTIAFDYGAEVIIEGPAEFELQTGKQMVLHSGRAFAKVPDYATGFTIETEYLTIIDLGTEFGVNVDSDGTAEVHMLKGRASLIPGLSGQKGKSCDLAAGTASRVDTSGQIVDIPIQSRKFVRRTSSQADFVWRGQDLDLADIVNGGNGFGTGDKNVGIDPASGSITSSLKGVSYRSGRPGYFRVSSNPYIDGVFIPDASEESNVVTSGGHVFAECPDTNLMYDTVIKTHTIHGPGWGGHKEKHLPYLGGTEYGYVANSLIYMHANCGITFDLEALRTAMPGIRIKRFTVVGGLEDSSYQSEKSAVWVLEDGVLEDMLDVTNTKENTEGVDYKNFSVDIDENCRFLTLIATDGGDGTEGDWTFFGNPVLELESY